eukprot:TRINITY_DN7555_c0_g1_i5.p2 TRINITY_DN7555_c0_g1~~TRINITY_DN7555_c0_g1_i5.p2  ORF type:complete len:165 (-),score=37.50 TRINITY_DN7555_c0_g1_i5:449-943(-)
MGEDDLKAELGASNVQTIVCNSTSYTNANGTTVHRCVVEFVSSDAAGQAAAAANSNAYPGVYAATVDGASPNPPAGSGPEESGSNTGVIIGVVVGVLVAVGVAVAVGVVVMRRRGADTNLYDMGSPLGDDASMGHFEMNDAIETTKTAHSVNQAPRPPLVDEDI